MINNNKEIIKELIEKLFKNPEALLKEPEEIIDNKDLMIMLMKETHEGYHLKYVSERLKNDKEVVLTAINNDGLAFKHASEELRNSKEIAKFALNKRGIRINWLINQCCEAQI